MKATLKFDLPTDWEEFKIASNARSYVVGMEDIFNILRNHIKYQDHSEEAVSILQDIKEEILQTIPEVCKYNS